MGRERLPYATFEKWQQWLDAETRSYLDPDGWERKDREMRENAVKKLGLGSPKAREEWLKNILEVLPKQLSTNPILEILVKDEALRERVASEPHRCPSLVSLALACTMSAFGAAADLGRPSEFADLSISRNSWTDARITSEAAYADIFVSKDKGQLARAKRLQAWGFFRPKLMRWDEFGGP